MENGCNPSNSSLSLYFILSLSTSCSEKERERKWREERKRIIILMQYWWGRRLGKIPKKQYTQNKQKNEHISPISFSFLSFPFFLYSFPFFLLCSWIFENWNSNNPFFFPSIFSSIRLFIRIIKMELTSWIFSGPLELQLWDQFFGIDFFGSVLVLSKNSVLILSWTWKWFTVVFLWYVDESSHRISMVWPEFEYQLQLIHNLDSLSRDPMDGK